VRQRDYWAVTEHEQMDRLLFRADFDLPFANFPKNSSTVDVLIRRDESNNNFRIFLRVD